MGLTQLKTGKCTMTQVGGVIGTPYYCAPESYKGRVCIASDIWSFGLVLSEIFEQWHAWGQLLSQVEMTGLIMSERLPPLDQDHLKTPIREIYEMCLHYDPKKRIDILSLTKNMKNVC